MSDNSKVKGVYQLDNGYWGYRFTMIVNGKTVSQRRVKDESGNPFKTEKKQKKQDYLQWQRNRQKPISHKQRLFNQEHLKRCIKNIAIMAGMEKLMQL